MGYSKITALSLTDLFVQQIENMILSGELAFGEQLPPARELAAKMGVSRTVVTAGLVELEKLGFVEIKARQGVYVCDYRRRGTMETLVAIMRYNGGALRQNEVRSLLETRDAMECMCMRLVVERSDTASLEALAPVLESIRTARDSDEAAENVFLFHHELAVLSGNVLMPLLYHSFRPQSVYLWTIDCKRSGIQKMYESKLALYTALLNGDAPTAVRLTHERIARAIEASSAHKNVSPLSFRESGEHLHRGGFSSQLSEPLKRRVRYCEITAARAHGDVRFACAVAVAAAGNAHAVCSRGGRLHSYLLYIIHLFCPTFLLLFFKKVQNVYFFYCEQAVWGV